LKQSIPDKKLIRKYRSEYRGIIHSSTLAPGDHPPPHPGENDLGGTAAGGFSGFINYIGEYRIVDV
jgi:hypothetical protein